MSEQTPDPQQPDERPVDAHTANDPAPRHPATASEGADGATAAPVDRDADAAPAATKRGRGLVKPILVGTGAALVVLAVAGVGLTVAEAMDDDGDDPVATQSSDGSPGASSDGDRDDRDGHGDHGDRGGRDDDALVAPDSASSEPTDLASAIEAAIGAAGGGAATSIEVERGGWSVDVRLEDGSEVDVRVPESGEPVVRADDDGDGSSDAPLDPARIAEISAAATGAAGGGTVLSIESEDDGRFDVEVAHDGVDVDVELGSDLAVIAVDR